MDNENSRRNSVSMQGDLTRSLFPGAKGSRSTGSDGMKRCMGCMEIYSEEFDVCPHCGYVENTEVENALHMFPGTILNDKYIVGKVIGYGGFGVTYIAWDTVLQTKVAIKEYLPSEFSTRAIGQTQVTVFSGDKNKQFNDGMEKFVEEAKKLAKFRNEHGIVNIFDSFSENGTAYIAMEYLQGETLSDRLERDKIIPVEEAIQLLMPIIESLNKVHDEGIIHRDIAPDNIFLTNNGEVKLIDFGAARYATTSRSRSLTVIIKPGYSAEEQYRSRGDQGPHTDVYSVGACIYRMVTGEIPPDAMERRAQFEKNHKDMLKPIRKFVKDIDSRRENAIYNAMNVRIEDRTPDMISLAGELTSEEPVKRRRSGIRKIDPLTWPLWAKIGIPAALSVVITLSALLAFGVIGPRSHLRNDYYVPDNYALVPNVVAMEFDKAKDKLAKSKLKHQIAGRKTSEIIPNGTVLTQDPDAFNVVQINSFVNIVYCDGLGMGHVPDVVMLDLEEARSEMENAGFKVKVTEQESSTIGPGAVISQQYEAKRELEKGTEIELVVSIGDSSIDTTVPVDIPDLVGMDYTKAEKILKGLKLYVKQQFEYNASIPTNQVVGQNPIAKVKGHQGDTVTLIVNQGERVFQMPDVIMMEYSEAEAKLKEIGLDVYIVQKENSEYSPGIVFEQSIPKNTDVKTGTKVTLTVSKGKQVIVPDVVGKKEKAAIDEISNAGLVASVTYKKDASVPKGVVISQSEKAGTKLQQGDNVNLTVSNGNKDIETGDKYAGSLLSISLDKKPSKTTYVIGESVDSNGMKVVASFADGSKRDVTSECKVESVKLDKTGSIQVPVSYTYEGVTKSTSFSVTVKGPSISLNPTSVNVVVGGTASVNANTNPSGGNVSWKSSNAKIATVSGGTITGVKTGSTTIKATFTYGGKSVTATCSVNVSNTRVAVEGISISSSSLSLTEGGSESLNATLQPANATGGKITWRTSDASVVTVNNGYVVAQGPGTATITASTSNGKSATCQVTVKAADVKSLKVTINDKGLQNYNLRETFKPRGITVIASTDNGNKYVTESASYNLEGSTDTAGKKNVTVSYGGKSATYSVTYVPTNIQLDKTKATIKVGMTTELTATTSSGTVTWTVDNGSIVSLNKTKGTTVVVKGLKKGTAKVTASVGGSDATAYITVEPEDRGDVDTIEVLAENVQYYTGDTIDLSNYKLRVTFKSGKTTTLTASEIRPNSISSKTGKQSITVIDGNYSKAYTITGIKVPDINLDKTELQMVAGKTENLKATATNKPSAAKIEWSSSNNNIAKVSNGVVSAQKPGSAKISVKLTNGSYSVTKTCNVTVTGKTVESISITKTPTKVTGYYVGDSVDTSGIKVMATYNDGSAPVDVTKNIDVAPGKFTSSGDQSVTVSYGGAQASFNVSVGNPEIEITVEGNTVISQFGGTKIFTIKTKPSTGDWTGFSHNSNASLSMSFDGKNKLIVDSTGKAKDGEVQVSAKYKNIEYSSNIINLSFNTNQTISKFTAEYKGSRNFQPGDKITTSDLSDVVVYATFKDTNYTQDEATAFYANNGRFEAASDVYEENGELYFDLSCKTNYSGRDDAQVKLS